MSESTEMLRAYVGGSEDAFGDIVRRHIDFVYSVALRKVAGDTHLAQDVTQTVFADLARKAKSLPKDVVLIGWLHRDTCFRAADAVRNERRRRAREQKAIDMQSLNETQEDPWIHLAPFLDDAMEKLSTAERDALLLRFIEGKSWREVGQALALSEDAVQKRAGRALDKLRGHLARRGIVISSAAMAAALAANSIQAAPAALAASVTGTALAGSGAASLTTSFVETLLMTTKTKVAIVAAAGIAAITTPIVWQHQSIGQLREQLTVTQRENSHYRSTAAALSASALSSNAILNWRALESPDYRQYIANLRAAGCPEQTIRDIIITDLERTYGRRIAKLSPPRPESRYWMREYQTVTTSRDRAVKEIEQEKRAAIRELLGVDADEESYRRTGVPVPYEEGFEFVAADKRAGLREIESQFRTLTASNNAHRAAWNERDYFIQRQNIAIGREEAIKALLTPAEFDEYEIRCGHHAQGLRIALSAFEPTEQEFRKILQIEKDFGKDKTYSDPREYGLPQGQPLDAATEQQFQDAVQQALGQERYAEFMLSRDNRYGFIHGLVEAHELPKENARALYDISKMAEKEAGGIRQNGSLTAEERQAALQAVRKQTEAEALRLLGEEGFRGYQWQFGR